MLYFVVHCNCYLFFNIFIIIFLVICMFLLIDLFDLYLQVKILYVRNLMLSTTEETLECLFNKAAGRDGAVDRVKKIRDYAFVHFHERMDAIRARDIINGKLILLSVLIVPIPNFYFNELLICM